MNETGPMRPADGMDQATAERIFRNAAERYIASRRTRIDSFVRSHFGPTGAFRVHRKAFGWDLLRAPGNLLLAVPHLATRIAEAGARRVRARRVANWIGSRTILLKTDVEREIEWLVFTELLELPIAQKGRSSAHDALAEAVLALPEVRAALEEAREAIAARGRDPEFRRRLDDNIGRYTGSRTAAADITAAFSTVGAGAVMFQQLTPSALTLGPMVAALVAQQAAVASFPLGAGLGAVWYGAFPAAPSFWLIAGVTGGLTAGVAGAAAFAGLITDPFERWTGLHRRRLAKLIDALEADLLGDREARLTGRGHYIARLLDLFEGARVAARMGH